MPFFCRKPYKGGDILELNEVNQRLKSSLYSAIKSKGFRQEITKLCKSYTKISPSVVIDVLERIIDMCIFNLQKHPEHKGWLFLSSDKLNNGLDRNRKTNSRALDLLADNNYMLKEKDKSNLNELQDSHQGLKNLLKAYPPPRGKQQSNYFLPNIEKIKAFMPRAITPGKQSDNNTWQRNYAKGMDAERQHNKIKEKPDEPVDDRIKSLNPFKSLDYKDMKEADTIKRLKEKEKVS